MGIFINALKKISITIEKTKNPLFSVDYKIQHKYINKFEVPRDDIERSYFQYLSQMKLYGVLGVFINVVSFPLILIYLITTRKKSNPNIDIRDSVNLLEGKSEGIIPDSLTQEYKNNIFLSSEEYGRLLTKNDRKLILNIWRKHPFSWHFILKLIIKLSVYSEIIVTHRPKAIIVCAEYTFTSSVLTYYCESKKILHINVMHGEKLYFIRDSFFRFDKCYVWNKYYENLFCDLRAYEKQFIIEMPELLKTKPNNVEDKFIDFTYYLSNENKKTILNIARQLKNLQSNGYIVSVRPHPRYTNQTSIVKYISANIIENINEIDIEHSLQRTKGAIALYSTVLNQAYSSGVNVIIDDMSNQEFYRKLFELKYINIERNHTLLSDILKGGD